MVLGNINDFDTYRGINKRIDIAMNYVSEFDFSKPDGRYDIDADNIFMNLVTVSADDNNNVEFEKHEKYIDFHIIISGSEKIYYAYAENCTVIKCYNEKEDYELLKGETSELNLTAGDFYLLFPSDAHAPGFKYRDTEFRKAIIKVKM